jgi:flagella basal body P-ring formation protein FlgA
MFAFLMATLVAMTSSVFATLAQAAVPLTGQIEQAARAELVKQSSAAGLVKPQFDLTVVAPRPAPPCAQPVTVQAQDTRQPARMRFVARCPDPGGWRYEYIVRARVSALVAVAATTIEANAPLTAEQVSVERRDVSSIGDPISAPEEAVGQSSRRMLRPGDILRASQLAAPILVKRGDQVLMVARRDGIEVSTTGEALDAGARGATVRVRNAASGQVLRMRVTGAGTVEPVELIR